MGFFDCRWPPSALILTRNLFCSVCVRRFWALIISNDSMDDGIDWVEWICFAIGDKLVGNGQAFRLIYLFYLGM